MKKKLQHLLLFIAVLASNAQAQNVADFETPLLPGAPGGNYWNGNDGTGGFMNGGSFFTNVYDTSFGGFWSSGFAYSSISDSVTSGFGNLYGAKANAGFGASAQYAVGQNNAIVRMPSTSATSIFNGVYITNGTYAFNSMRDGDSFSRKFGDTTGTGSGLPQGSYPDFFKVTISGYANGALINDSVDFYLADFRFANDSLDYIVKTWEWVDCAALGFVDSVFFSLSSSDNGAFGMNTPAFFCLDNFTTDVTVATSSINFAPAFTTFPNPANEILNLQFSDNGEVNYYSIVSINGAIVLPRKLAVSKNEKVDISNLTAGMYFVKIETNAGSNVQKFLKK